MKNLRSFFGNIKNKAKEVGKDALAVAKKRYLIPATALALAGGIEAQDFTTNYKGDMSVEEFFPENLKNLDYNYANRDIDDYDTFMNPFFQPNDTSYIWYGSGDVDSSGVIDWNDYDAMTEITPQTTVLATPNSRYDRADVDGDGITATEEDQQLLSDYLNGNIEYLPGHWNYLQTREERESWLEEMLAVTQTDTLEWTQDEGEESFVSGHFASQICLEFWGWEPHSVDETGEPNMADTLWTAKYNTATIGRFNMPTYFMPIIFPNNEGGHGMNAILLGDDPLNPQDWSFVEPQNDDINVQPGGWNIPYGSHSNIYSPRGFNDRWTLYHSIMIRGPPIASFSVDSVGNITLRESNYFPNPDLILERPPLAVDDEITEVPASYELNQNYPNPFNSSTILEYSLPSTEDVKIDIYDIGGRHLETIVNQEQTPGTHSIEWDASGYSSGIYFYNLSTGSGHSEAKKMILIK